MVELKNLNVGLTAINTWVTLEPSYNVRPISVNCPFVGLYCLVYVLLSVVQVMLSAVLPVAIFAHIVQYLLSFVAKRILAERLTLSATIACFHVSILTCRFGVELAALRFRERLTVVPVEIVPVVVGAHVILSSSGVLP